MRFRADRFGVGRKQPDVAERLDVAESSIWNWEAGHSQPDLRCMPGIIRFLAYRPQPEATTLASRLVQHRRILGMSQKELAAEFGVDPGTFARWERREREPTGGRLAEVRRFLDGGDGRRKVRRGG